MPLLGSGYQWSSPIIGGYVGNITVPHGSWGNMNTSHYRWVLPEGGSYELHASLRNRIWGSTGYIKFRVYRNSDGNASADDVKMGLESQQSTANYLNAQIHLIWTVSCSSADTFYLQGQSSVNSAGLSLQSDGNGRNECFFRRLN